VVPVVITVYQDKTFTFVTRARRRLRCLKRAAGLAKGSRRSERERWDGDTGTGSGDCEIEGQDLNARDEERAMAHYQDRAPVWESM